MILGFDHDDATIFDAQRQFIKEARIALSMTGMLHAIPKTPLHARLAEEGRLDPADEPEFGTNVIPLQMTREELREGYVEVMCDLYDPEAYFKRLESLYLNSKLNFGKGIKKFWRRHPWKWLKAKSYQLVASTVLYHRLMRGIPDQSLRRGAPDPPCTACDRGRLAGEDAGLLWHRISLLVKPLGCPGTLPRWARAARPAPRPPRAG